jgi:hypothetical protein
VEERDAVNEVLTSGKRGFVSFVDRYTLWLLDDPKYELQECCGE